MDLPALDKIIREQEQILKENEVPLNFNKFLSAKPPQPETPHIDLQIQRAAEELRMLEAEYIQVRTKELFMKTLLMAKSLDDLPTAQDTARAEIALEVKMEELCKVQDERREAESELTTTIAQLGHAVHDLNRGRDEANRSLQQARVVSSCASARNILQSDDWAQIESLVPLSYDLDASCCQELINTLREEMARVEPLTKQKTAVVENLMRDVGELESDVQDLITESNRLKQVIAAQNNRNPRLVKPRHECMLEQELGKILSSLTGVRVSEIRKNGISFHVDPNVLVPRKLRTKRHHSIYTVEIELVEDLGSELIVSTVSIVPEDISLADVCNKTAGASNNITVDLCVLMQTICSRLLAFVSRKASD